MDYIKSVCRVPDAADTWCCAPEFASLTKVMYFRLVVRVRSLYWTQALYSRSGTVQAVQYKRYTTSGKNYRMEHMIVRNKKNEKLRIEQT